MKESFIKRFVEQTIQIYYKPQVRFTQKGKIGRLHLFFALKNRFLKKRGNWRKNEKNAGNPAFFRVHLFCMHYVVETRGVEFSPAGSVGVGSDMPPACHSLPTRSTPSQFIKQKGTPLGCLCFMATLYRKDAMRHLRQSYSPRFLSHSSASDFASSTAFINLGSSLTVSKPPTKPESSVNV